MNTAGGYSYTSSIKSDLSDELINTYVLRPVAGLLVRILYRTPVTPNHVTLAAVFWGIASAILFLCNSPQLTAAAGISLTLKDLLDSADGQLARAKQLYSRAGRFLDSIGDFLVNLLVFAAISHVLFLNTGTVVIYLLGFLAFLCITLRVSYHVFYHTSYLHLQNSYTLNRVIEDKKEEDHSVDSLTFALHTVFLWLYGWQDTLMAGIDGWCKRKLLHSKECEERWYGNPTGLRLSGLLGLGTELFLLMVCSVLNRLELYLLLNLVLMNGVWLVAVMYRRYWLAVRLVPMAR